jgi:16S rRNA (cytosine1402-N4)-methyltransferase
MSGSVSASVHLPVLLEESVEALRAREGGLFLDCTFGGGGHTRAILDASPDAWVVAFDRDVRAIERASAWRERYGDRLELIHAPFSEVEQCAAHKKFDGILADLGISTDQLKEGRGFSFADSAALDMRMDEGRGSSVAEFIASAREQELYIALAKGGVGKNARAIARMLVRERPFASAKDLADRLRSSSLGKSQESGVHPATVVFQALRMHVNQELQEIEALLAAVPQLVKPHARVAIITFHSGEDTCVTRTLREWEAAETYPASWRGPREGKRRGHSVTRKPIVPSEGEISRNNAARSARLRVFEFES